MLYLPKTTQKEICKTGLLGGFVVAVVYNPFGFLCGHNFSVLPNRTLPSTALEHQMNVSSEQRMLPAALPVPFLHHH